LNKEQDTPSLALACSMCNNTQRLVTDSESGETICSNCGRVISEKTPVTERRWDVVNPEKVNNGNRTGIPASLSSHDMGLATIIGNDDRDVSGNKIDIAMRSTMNRLRTWDFRTKVCTSTDRNLLQASNVLDILKDKLALSDAIIERSAYIYRKVQEIGFVRGRSIITVAAAAAYIACREMGITRTLDDISTSCDIRRKILSKTFRQLIIEFDFIVPMVDPVKCIVRVANKANLSEKTKRQAIRIMNDITTKDEILLSAGKDPMGLAATILYLSSLKTGENITQNNISNAAGVTAVTLRNRFRDLKKQLQLLGF
jgi:transcription initiation factor TFIIB